MAGSETLHISAEIQSSSQGSEWPLLPTANRWLPGKAIAACFGGAGQGFGLASDRQREPKRNMVAVTFGIRVWLDVVL